MERIIFILALLILLVLFVFGVIYARKERKRAPWGRFPVSKKPFVEDNKLGIFPVKRIERLPDVDVAFLADYCDALICLGQDELKKTYRAAQDVLENRRLARKAFWEMKFLPSGLPFLKEKKLLRADRDFWKKISAEDRKVLFAYAKSKIFEGDRRFVKFYLRLARTR